MNVLLVSKPGISLIRSLRESETAWDAIRFYGPVGISIGVYIPVSTLAGAISLASDLKYFLRKYTTDHLFLYHPGVYFTAALARSRYLTRDNGVTPDWPYRLIYWIENQGTVRRWKKDDWNCDDLFAMPRSADQDSDSKPRDPDIEETTIGGYLFEVWCTRPEYEIM